MATISGSAESPRLCRAGLRNARNMVALASLLGGLLSAAPSFAAQDARAAPILDRYHITAEERTACGQDAIELCSDAYPDEGKLLSCMKTNRVSLSTGCRPIFEEGIRRRHLN